MAFQYAVKFVCGDTDGGAVARGEYFTAINVHNPTEEPISFGKKFALAGEEAEQPGPVSDFFSAELGPDQVLEIDCRDIFDHTANISSAAFRKGFVIIQSEVELDVVAVYTAAGLFGRVKTMHLERVAPSS
ncbi:MAG: hypothetical protein ACFFEW_17995 [Candidatus Thorarchaeota archaeon]